MGGSEICFANVLVIGPIQLARQYCQALSCNVHVVDTLFIYVLSFYSPNIDHVLIRNRDTKITCGYYTYVCICYRPFTVLLPNPHQTEYFLSFLISPSTILQTDMFHFPIMLHAHWMSEWRSWEWTRLNHNILSCSEK